MVAAPFKNHSDQKPELNAEGHEKHIDVMYEDGSALDSDVQTT